MPAANGYVPTPAPVADLAAMETLAPAPPAELSDGGRLLLPGLGTGNLYAGVRRYCTPGAHWERPSVDQPLPSTVGVENDPQLVGAFRTRRPAADVTVQQADFLLDPPEGPFDWAVLNPPYTRYQRIPDAKREQYRDRFDVATGRFPLYAPFVEQTLELVKAGGWVTVLLPVQLLETVNAAPLRDLLDDHHVGRVSLLPSATFDRQVDALLIAVKNEPSDSTAGLWVEPALAYTVAPLLERLGVDDVEAAEDTYYEQLRSRKAYLRGNTVESAVRSARVERRRDGDDDQRAAAGTRQAEVGRWAE